MSQTITPQTVTKMASLAKISNNPSEEEIQEHATNLSQVLDYVEELREVDVTGVSATDIIPTTTLDNLRADEPPQDQDKYQQVRHNIICNFPQKQGDLLVLPTKIIE
jgi:aspartyl-tRNA(Asn)/glutamyl-tRNA(Gln) amidotransferase subunit C